MVTDLMPLSTEAPRCSEFARTLGVLPPGTGLFLERVVLVSVPLPWPKPALNHPVLKPAVASVTASKVATRLFAVEPTADNTTGTGNTAGNTIVEVYERAGAGASVHAWELGDASDVQAAVGAIAGTDHGALGELGLGSAHTGRHAATAPPTFLVCTQGSHDTCCGTSGVALADQLEHARPDLVVRRVSHTGGHRFSPTFLAFPEGRMWAFADLALVDRILADTTTASDHLRHARGWWGAKVGPAQVAECAVRAEMAGQPFVEPHVQPTNDVPGQPATEFSVTSGAATFHVQVRVGRQVPTVACEAPGGLPAKPGREFAYDIERQ